MRSDSVLKLMLVGAFACLGLVLWAKAGDLNPPAGPVGPTMKTLDQIYSAIGTIPGGGGGGVNRVVRGVILLPDGQYESTPQSFSPSIDPAKSVVVLSDSVLGQVSSGTPNYLSARNGACVMDLTASSITVAIDQTAPTGPRRVSYQIIEYN